MSQLVTIPYSMFYSTVSRYRLTTINYASYLSSDFGPELILTVLIYSLHVCNALHYYLLGGEEGSNLGSDWQRLVLVTEALFLSYRRGSEFRTFICGHMCTVHVTTYNIY
jgi:hypothetical protein